MRDEKEPLWLMTDKVCANLLRYVCQMEKSNQTWRERAHPAK